MAFPERVVLPLRRPFPTKVFLLLVGVVAFGIAAVIPYKLTLLADTFEAATASRPLWQLLLLDLAAKTAVFGLLAALGLLAACRIGTGLPLLEGVRAPDRRVWLLAVMYGAAAGLLIIGLDLTVFKPLMLASGSSFGEVVKPPAWQGFLASFYGGITEEVLLRLFLLSVLAWLGGFLSRAPDGRPSPGVFRAAIVLTALAFGAGHLPAASAAGLPLDAVNVARILVLNGVGGLLLGWLYWRYGLESAMLSHFTLDLLLHVLF